MKRFLSLFPLSGALLTASPTDNLVSYWALDNNLTDSAQAGTSSDSGGTWVGTAAYEDGQFGTAMSTGGNAYVSIPSSSDIDGSSQTLTVSAWFDVDTFDNNWQALIAKGEGNNWRLARRGATFQLAYAGGADDISGGPSVNNGGWRHVVAVSEEGKDTRLYIDGELEATGGEPNLEASANPLFLGSNPDEPTRIWNGKIDDVGIFNRALNPLEVATIFNLGDGTLDYSLAEVNQLLQLGQDDLGATLSIGDTNWEKVTEDPGDDRTFIQLSPDGSGVAGSMGPMIFSATVDHPRIPVGFPVMLNWQIETSFNLVGLSGVGQVDTTNVQGVGSFLIDPGPTETTTYRFVCSDATGIAVRLLTVEVTDQPIIESFTATPAVATPGETVTISWVTLGTAEVTLNGQTVAASGTESFTADSSKQFTLAVENDNGIDSRDLGVLVLVPGEPIITEFLSDNDGGIEDEDGDHSDWIQITNATNQATVINDDHFLTDDEGNLTKWALPNQTIAPGESILVFASSKDRTTPEAHTNFSLSSDGEYLALIKVSDGITKILSVFNEYPRQFRNTSYGVLPENLARYFYLTSPTPTEENSGDSFADFVRDTSFSINRGVYDSPQTVEITSATQSVRIYYTIDGSEPDPLTSTLYEEPLIIDDTTILRALGTRSGFLPTNVDTQTYLFPTETAENQGTVAQGWPTNNVNSQVLDYEIDTAANGAPSEMQVADALIALPSISIVTDQANLTDSARGIYVNADQRGREAERPGSLELIFPPGYDNPDGEEEGFQIDMGLRIRGGFSRSDANPKHSFRFFFRRDYGDATLNYPLFGDEGVNEYQGFDLRTSQNYSWSFRGREGFDSSLKNTFLRDVFARDSQRDMGQPYTRSRYYHLYLNGLYWGVFMSQERAEADFAESYLGGDDSEYDTLKSAGRSEGYTTETTDGNEVDWMEGYTLSQSITGTTEGIPNYLRIQGLNANGVRDESLPVHVDVENMAAYHLAVFYCGSFDGPLSTFVDASNNWFALRNRETDDRGWTFFAHDFEHSMDTNPNSIDRTGPFWFGSTLDQQTFPRSNPQYFHQYMMASEEYRLKFGDIVHREFFYNGAFTHPEVLARIDRRIATLDPAIDAEAARWGDSMSPGNPLNKSDWENAVNLMKGWTNDRRDVVLTQLKNDGLYPAVDAPQYNQHGGSIPSTFQLTITNSNASGTTYYTLDGSDPREFGGTASATASQGNSVTLSGSTTVNSRVLQNGEWSALNSAEFVAGTQPEAGQLVISEINYHPYDPTTAEIMAGFDDDDDFEFIEITNRSNLALDLTNLTIANEAVYAFTNLPSITDRVLAAGESITIARNAEAFAMRYPGVTAFGDFAEKLSNNSGTVELRLNGSLVLFSVSYDDNNGWPDAADGDGPTLVLRNEANPNSPTSWRISSTSGGNPGTSDSILFTGTAGGDNNQNGIDDLLEAVLQNSSGDYVSPIGAVTKVGADRYLTITLTRRINVDNTILYIEGSTTLASWPLTQLPLVTRSFDAPGIVTETYRLPESIVTNGTGFMRVRVALD